MKKYTLPIIILLFSFLMQYCAPSVPPEKERIMPPERLLKKIEGNRRKVKTFVGNGVINVESPNFSGSATFEIKMKKPDSIKISIYGPFGIELAHGLVSKNEFSFYDVMRNNLYKGDLSQKVLQEIFKIDLSFDDLIDAFSGSINLTDKLIREPDNYEQNTDSFLLTYIDNKNKNKSTFLIDNNNLALLKYKIMNEKNTTILESDYKDFELFDEVPIPYKTDVNYAKNNQKLSLDYRKIRVNQTVENLKIDLPKDVNIIQW